MDLRRLSYFVAVAEHEGFSAASRRIHVAQPAISLAVKELEGELGAELFVRLGRRVTLTAAGQALLGPARQALRDVATGRAAVAAVTGMTSGSLSLCCLPTLAADPLSGLIGRFRRSWPGVLIELSAAGDGDGVVGRLRDGTCELGVSEPVEAPDLVCTELAIQELAVILPPGSPPPPDPFGIAELAGVPLIVGPTGTSTREVLEEGFAVAGVEPAVAVVTAQRDAILPLVVAGAGAAVVPLAMATVAAALGAVVTRPEPGLTRRVAVLRRRGPVAPAADRFLELAFGGAPG
ncbi:MAG TPA: LysR substrate-binding domain-containing protein [Acidimicrobiales bacterium]|nr:LysR substrate-binding domain-containing protein [Acidimicrobiales bacterium]